MPEEEKPWDEKEEPKPLDWVVLSFQIAATASLLLVVYLICYYPLRYLSEYTVLPWVIGVAIFGLAHIPMVWLIHKWFRTRLWTIITLVTIIATLLLPASAVWPGGLTFQFYGITVAGVCPLPFFDITVDGDGNVGLRDKKQEIKVEELRALMDDELEVIIIGTGWEESCRVDHRISGLRGVHIQIMSTPIAFEQYDRLREQGVRVALIVNTTS